VPFWNWLVELARRLAMLVRRGRFDHDLDEELRLHAELKEAEYAGQGLPPDEARRRARTSLGSTLRWREESHDAWGWAWLETLGQDLRYGVRLLHRSPGFTLVAVFTLALGLGATTAIFSVVESVLLRPLPYADANRVIVLRETTPKVGTVSVSYPDFLDWRAQSRTFGAMAAVYSETFNLGGVDRPENINGEAVSPDFLAVLGVHPALGRDFEPSEEKAGTAPVALLSDRLWQSHFGRDPLVIGRTIRLDGASVTIVGILPPDFRSPDEADVIEPIGVWATGNDDMQRRGSRGDMAVVGRLAPGATLAGARSEMTGIAAQLAQTYPATNDQFGVALEPIRDTFVGDVRPAILVLFGAVLFVLLIACANVANLFLVRGAARAREVALRITCGASRGRILRQMLTESVVLAAVGGVLGVALALAGIPGITWLAGPDLPAGSAVALDGTVLLFTGATVLVAAVLFGLVPAVYATRADLQSELRDSGRTTSASREQHRLRSVLAAAEIALALILLVGAGLMTRSLSRLVAVDPGFQPDHVSTAELTLTTPQYDDDAAMRRFWNELLGRVRALPGVEAAAAGTGVPMTNDHSRADVTLEGMPLPRAGSWPHPDIHRVSPGYLGTLGVPLVRGRDFTDADGPDTPRVALVSAPVADQFFPHQDAVGKRLMFGHPDAGKAPAWLTIVGVVGPTKLYGLANPPRLEVYVSARQYPSPDMTLVVKSGLDAPALNTEIRGAVRAIDRDQPVFNVATMSELMKTALATQRVVLVLLGLFSGVALVLAAIGIYGVIAYTVARRTHEVGIRLALGAERHTVLRMILAQGATLAGAGIAAGLILAFGLTRVMAALLYSVSAADPVTFAAMALLLLLVALLASYVPARRAVNVSPTIALRAE
jgi:putative ABC transport system permease protein